MNQISTLAKRIGRPPVFDTPDDLWKAAVSFMEWCEANPLQEEQLFAYQGIVTREVRHKVRAMTLEGLWLHAGMGRNTWYQYKERDGFREVCTRIEDAFRAQKFTAAAAELLNPSIIARDLGLADKQQTEHSGTVNVVSPIKWSDE